VSALRAQDPSQKIVVIAIAPGAVTTPWVKSADAVLMLFMPGEQVGNAAADLIIGEQAPGGRLPISLPEEDEQRFTPEQYPGTPFNDVNMTAKFSEGVLVGYRWNIAKGIPSAFPFGFGLTYTEFEYGTPTVTPVGTGVKITVEVSNVGKQDAAAIPQVYVGFKSLKPAVFQLRGFQKVSVPAGGSQTATIELGPEDWSFYDSKKSAWACAAEMGEKITVSMGRSSADMFWSAALTLQGGSMVATQMPVEQGAGSAGADYAIRSLTKQKKKSL
jgi:beta-glucosidase